MSYSEMNITIAKKNGDLVTEKFMNNVMEEIIDLADKDGCIVAGGFRVSSNTEGWKL
jgi:hypothetical protein